MEGNKSLTLFKTYLKVFARLNLNGLIYYLGKIPLLSSLIPPSIYGMYKLKDSLGILGLLIAFVKNIMMQLMLVYLLLVWIPMFITGEVYGGPDFHRGHVAYLFLVVMCLAYALLGSRIFAASSMDYTMLNHFQVDPNKYYKANLVVGYIGGLAVSAVVLLYVVGDVKWVLFLLAFKGTAYGVGNFVHLYGFVRLNRMLPPPFSLSAVGIVMACTYGALYYGVFPEFIAFKGMAILGGLMLGLSLFPWLYVLKYDQYKKVANKYVNKEVMALSSATVSVSATGSGSGSGSSSARQGQSELMTFSEDQCEAYYQSHKSESPIVYLHKTFSWRYKKTLRRFVVDNGVGTFVLFVVLGLLVRQGFIPIKQEGLMGQSSSLFMFLFTVSSVRRYTQLCYRQVDLPLLKNRFYTAQGIKDLMNIRMLVMLRNTCISCLAFGIALVAFLGIAGLRASGVQIAMVGLTCLVVLVLHETYYFLVYYGIQPFTQDVVISSWIYKGSNWVFNLFSVYVLFVRRDMTVLLVPMALGLVAMGGVYWLVYNRVDRTFRLR